MLDQINNILGKIDNFVWGVPLIVLILLVGIFLTIRLKGLQIRKFPLAVKYLFENEKSGESGEVSSFAALCTALSATIGTGNIVGVATALVEGGAPLSGAHVRATDLRAGAALVIAGLATAGKTEIDEIYLIERGYDDIVNKLSGLGADIRKVILPDPALYDRAN